MKKKSESTLPVSREKFQEFFDYASAGLDTIDCNHDLRFAIEFLNNHQTFLESVAEFLQKMADIATAKCL